MYFLGLGVLNTKTQVSLESCMKGDSNGSNLFRIVNGCTVAAEENV